MNHTIHNILYHTFIYVYSKLVLQYYKVTPIAKNNTLIRYVIIFIINTSEKSYNLSFFFN